VAILTRADAADGGLVAPWPLGGAWRWSRAGGSILVGGTSVNGSSEAARALTCVRPDGTARWTSALPPLSAHRISVRYKQSRLGVLWAVLQPLAIMLAFTLVFSLLGGAPSEGVPYAVFAYAALVPWTAFASGLSNATSSGAFWSAAGAGAAGAGTGGTGLTGAVGSSGSGSSRSLGGSGYDSGSELEPRGVRSGAGRSGQVERPNRSTVRPPTDQSWRSAGVSAGAERFESDGPPAHLAGRPPIRAV